MLALRIPEAKIDHEEAKMLAEAIGRVDAHYNVISKFTGPAADWLNLFMVLGTIYGLRAGAYAMRKQQEAKARTRGPAGNVQLVQ